MFSEPLRPESFCWAVPEFSSLWQPVLHPPPLTAFYGGDVQHGASTFGYFAAPLASRSPGVGCVRFFVAARSRRLAPAAGRACHAAEKRLRI